MARHWDIVGSDETGFDAGIGFRASIGMIALSVDRASEADCAKWAAPFTGTAIFTTRVPMSAQATPESLASMGEHLAEAAARLVPGGRLDAIAFSCTSGLVAIGTERVRRLLGNARPGVPVVTPIEAAVRGLRLLGIRRLSLLVPYHPITADLVAGYFEDNGFDLDRCTTFDLDGDPEMNRLSPTTLKAGAHRALHPDSDGLFISCTGLRTSGIVAELEAELVVPVLTSNQVMIWECLTIAGCADLSPGEGRLFELLAR